MPEGWQGKRIATASVRTGFAMTSGKSRPLSKPGSYLRSVRDRRLDTSPSGACARSPPDPQTPFLAFPCGGRCQRPLPSGADGRGARPAAVLSPLFLRVQGPVPTVGGKSPGPCSPQGPVPTAAPSNHGRRSRRAGIKAVCASRRTVRKSALTGA